MPNNSIKLPYLPEGKEIKYVDIDNPFMLMAQKVASEQTGCSWWPTGAVLIKDEQLIGSGANSGILTPFCPRVEHDCATGEGYHYCKEICHQTDHAEVNAINNTLENKNDPSGADLYLFGHWWCCQNCWDYMIKHGINNVYLLNNADTIFTRENRLKTQQKIKQKIDNNDTITLTDIVWEI